MKKLIVVLALLVISLVSGVANEEEYASLTYEEAGDWIFSQVGLDIEPETGNPILIIQAGLIEFVIKYDYVEHVVPIVPIPNYAVIITENDVLIVPEEEEMDLRIGHLQYSLIFPSQTFKDIIPPPKRVSWLLPAGIGLVVGVGITVLIALLVK